jgi:hypothetical protein
MGIWMVGLATILLVVGQGESRGPRIPDELLKTDLQVFVQWLDAARPAPLTARYRARLLSALPATGEISRLDDRGQRKVAAVRRLLQATGRGAEYEIKVVDVTESRVGVFERAVILITEPALTTLEAEELQSLAAHEIGHEYFTAEYEGASAMKDTRRLKEVELMCDAVALVTLERLHMNPSRLMSAVEKTTSYNRLHFNDEMDERGYPTVSERGAFARKVTAWIARGRGNVSALLLGVQLGTGR